MATINPKQFKSSESENGSNVIRPTEFVPSHQRETKSRRLVKPTIIVSSVLFIVLTPVIWFLLTAKALVIESESQVSSIQITGGLQFKLRENYLLRQGTYEVSASSPGYYPLIKTINIGDAQNQKLTLEFVPLPGKIQVNLGRDQSGKLFLNDELIGDTGVEIANVDAGQHELKILNDMYKPLVTQIEVEGKQKFQQFEYVLEPNWADVSLDSTPAGAEVLVDGVVIGKTPLSTPVLAGNRAITISLQGYQSWQTEFEITAQKELTIPVVNLLKIEGTIVVSTQPIGAGIMIDEKFVGTSPLEVSLPPDKVYQISLFKDGYQSETKSVSLLSNKKAVVDSQLKPLLAKIKIQSDQQDALLYVNDVLMGRAHQTITLTAKKHSLVIKKDGYVDYQTEILPKLGRTQSVDITMKTLEQAEWENIKPVITTKTGTELKLFKPESSVFTMGASRREQGRRANEAQRRVKLTKPFYFATKEISNKEFRQYIRQHSSGHVQGKSLNSDNYPAVKVSWQQAALFCNWLSKKENLPPFYKVESGQVVGLNVEATGYRMPLETEWAWLARFNKKESAKYAWGKQLPPNKAAGNIGDRSGATLLGQIQLDYNDRYAVTAPLASFAADQNGIFDLSGNVAEWMTDFYEIKTGLSGKIEEDPISTLEGNYHVIRGSSWRHGSMTELRQAFRDYGDEGRDDLGFRIARFVK